MCSSDLDTTATGPIGDGKSEPLSAPYSPSQYLTYHVSVQPILAAIEAIAAHCDVCSVRCSNTIRTARSRISAENLGDVL